VLPTGDFVRSEGFADETRPSGAVPVMRRHKPSNTGRIVINGPVSSSGRCGSARSGQLSATGILGR